MWPARLGRRVRAGWKVATDASLPGRWSDAFLYSVTLRRSLRWLYSTPPYLRFRGFHHLLGR